VTVGGETKRPGRGVVARIDAASLEEVGSVERFDYEDPFGNVTEGVAVRLESGIVAFQNVCPHLGFALDCHSSEFGESGGEVLECDAHGARFDVDSGRCVAGPCEGERLEIFEVETDESAGEIVVRSGGRSLSL